MLRVYISGPISDGETLPHHVRRRNVREAMRVADELMERGFIPFLPHINYWWGVLHNRPFTDWIEWDNAWLDMCDVLLRLPGKSHGADLEVAYAHRKGIRVVYSMEDL